MDTTTETIEHPDNTTLPPTATVPLVETHPQAREEQPKPPTLNALLVERMERIEGSVSSVAQDVGYYGQETITALARLNAQTEDHTFLLRVTVVALIFLALAFGVVIGMGLVMAVHG